jgi:hypothetical protein
VVSSDSGQTKQGLSFWQKFALTVTIAIFVVLALVWIASQTLVNESLGG